MINIAICDDESIICENIEKIILQFSVKNGQDLKVEKFNSAENLLYAISQETKFDLIFLDIEMNGQTGLDAAHEIRERYDDHTTQIAFVTGKQKYMKNMFKVQPIDYIEKPISAAEIENVIRLINKHAGKSSAVFKYKHGHAQCSVPVNDILYFMSYNRRILIKTRKISEFFYSNLNDIENELKKYGFFSPHKSYVVNYYQIKSFYANEIVMNNREIIPISQQKRKYIDEIQLTMAQGGMK